jgi:hypothetical protein
MDATISLRNTISKRKKNELTFEMFSYGVDLIPIDLQKEKPKKYWQPIPPPTGFGSDEDSLGSVFSLQNKPPRKDLNKMFLVRK